MKNEWFDDVVDSLIKAYDDHPALTTSWWIADLTGLRAALPALVEQERYDAMEEKFREQGRNAVALFDGAKAAQREANDLRTQLAALEAERAEKSQALVLADDTVSRMEDAALKDRHERNALRARVAELEARQADTERQLEAAKSRTLPRPRLDIDAIARLMSDRLDEWRAGPADGRITREVIREVLDRETSLAGFNRPINRAPLAADEPLTDAHVHELVLVWEKFDGADLDVVMRALAAKLHELRPARAGRMPTPTPEQVETLLSALCHEGVAVPSLDTWERHLDTLRSLVRAHVARWAGAEAPVMRSTFEEKRPAAPVVPPMPEALSATVIVLEKAAHQSHQHAGYAGSDQGDSLSAVAIRKAIANGARIVNTTPEEWSHFCTHFGPVRLPEKAPETIDFEARFEESLAMQRALLAKSAPAAKPEDAEPSEWPRSPWNDALGLTSDRGIVSMLQWIGDVIIVAAAKRRAGGGA